MRHAQQQEGGNSEHYSLVSGRAELMVIANRPPDPAIRHALLLTAVCGTTAFLSKDSKL